MVRPGRYEGEEVMTDGETAYLAMVLGAFTVFALVLVFYSRN